MIDGPLPTGHRRRGGTQQAATPESLSAQNKTSEVNKTENENIEQISEHELRSYVKFYGGDSDAFASHESPMMDVDGCDSIFRQATACTVCVWMLLVATVYAITPSDEWEYLQGKEKEAAIVAFYVLVVSLFFVLIQPLGLLQIDATRPCQSNLRVSKKWSGILVAAVAVQCIAISTNALLAWAPTVVRVDPITGARVFLLRWCEWAPLAGLLTFLAEAVDLPRRKSGIRVRIYSALLQAISTTSGIIFPFCPNPIAWGICMIGSMVAYIGIFPRVWFKRQQFLQTPRGTSLMEMEHYDRIAFAYYLVLTCSIVWTVLVVFYMLQWFFIRFLFADDLTHPLRQPHLAMTLDTIFDVLAKAMYMKLIVDVHRIVFDADGRTQRQLEELRRLTSILWDSVSDVIVISVRHADKTTTMFNPSFQTMVGGGLPAPVGQLSTSVLIIESIGNNETGATPSAAYFTDSAHMLHRDTATDGLYTLSDSNIDNRVNLPLDSHLAEEAWGIFSVAWESRSDSTNTRPLIAHPMHHVDGEDLSCELKVSARMDNARIVVVRDVTERYRRFEAERRAHEESLARQQDAQAINRFTRHEVKNGLLVGIELCDSLKNSYADVDNGIQLMPDMDAVSGGHGPDRNTVEKEPIAYSAIPQIQAGMSRLIKELDSQLHQTLDTVLAEAMARDIIHEVYEPRLERVNIKDVLAGSAIDIGRSLVFPLELIPADIPNLLLDPQQVRYIHRNAVSNACKYGKPGGVVKTTILYHKGRNELEMLVINEPGHGHAEIIALGEDASGAVFAQGKLLHNHLQSGKKYVSSGDGAWIMQKCARTMKGECSIRFEEGQTVFCFTCPAAPLAESNLSSSRDFVVPDDTWAIAIDDSRIQRKIMTRILLDAGVDRSRLLILGKEASEVDGCGDLLRDLLQEYPKAKFLVLVDENLDFLEADSEQVVLSGSVVLNEILHNLPPEDEARVLVLVRSANDSAKDVERYLERTHGFFPKAPMQQERIREILEPLWNKRFPVTNNKCSLPRVSSETSIDLFAEFVASLERIDGLVNESSANDSWSAIWGVLHQLKGDLIILEPCSNLSSISSWIESMRGSTIPTDFPGKWPRLRQMIEHEVTNI
jgi:signal transduction histidine kinase